MDRDNKGKFIKGSKVNVGRVRTEEEKNKIRNTLLSKHLSAWNKGKPWSEESKEKMRKPHKKCSHRRKCHKHTDETKIKMMGRKGYWLGKKRPELSGENNHLWKGGISKDKDYINRKCLKRLMTIIKLKECGLSHTKLEWEQLLIKTGNICLCCKEKKKLTKDHIIPLSKGGTDQISNLQPLCQDCNTHKWTKTTNYLCTDTLRC
jgi:5-methylcytosine-specific restriction endonuclease McrA